MKKFFKYLGFSMLLSISFFYTEKTASVVKDMDDIMIKIKEVALEHKVLPIEAIIENDTIIPGINGSEIDVNNSYKEMRYIGEFNQKYLKYKKINVKNKLSNNKDKYIISGNKHKKDVSLMFIVEDNTDCSTILNILKNNGISATFMISGSWLEKNNNLIYQFVKDNHIVGSIGYNYSYDNPSYPWLDNVIKKITKEKYSYCLKNTNEDLNVCSQNNNYTIDSFVINNNPFNQTKNLLSNGYIYIYKITNDLEEQLNLIIKYINSKDYNIVNIKNLLEE